MFVGEYQDPFRTSPNPDLIHELPLKVYWWQPTNVSSWGAFMGIFPWHPLISGQVGFKLYSLCSSVSHEIWCAKLDQLVPYVFDQVSGVTRTSLQSTVGTFQPTTPPSAGLGRAPAHSQSHSNLPPKVLNSWKSEIWSKNIKMVFRQKFRKIILEEKLYGRCCSGFIPSFCFTDFILVFGLGKI